ncbi:hypothetical protein [Spirosoma sp.]|uniref:hypothetical protein n=1 Tax=Spirosoma sp. TaxID=1899569 RepID=UPI003B3A1ABB
MVLSSLFYRVALISITAFTLANCYTRPSAESSATSPPKPTTEVSLSGSKKDRAKPYLGTFRLFLDNSFSMDGYVKKNTAYKQVLLELLNGANIDMGDMTVQVFAVNNLIYPLDYTGKSVAFVNQITPENKNWKQGSVYNSDLIQIFENALAEAKAGDITVVMSDCLYTGSNLDLAKQGMKGVFGLVSKKQPFKAAIYQFKAEFHGTYVYPDEKKTDYLDGQARPFYVWIMGSPVSVNTFLARVKPNVWPGYINAYVLSNQLTNHFYTISSLEQIGRYQTPSDNTIDYAELETGTNSFQFSVAAQLPTEIDATYLRDVRNYTVSNAKFRVEKVIPLAGYAPKTTFAATEFNRVRKTTANYLLLVRTTGLFADGAYNIRLINHIPNWVSQSHTAKLEESIQPTKTYALLPLLQGVTAGFTSTSLPPLADFSFHIEKNN